MRRRPRVLALVGATATGKTAVAERIAGQAPVAIVCADARQLFAELEIGTGKPTPAERRAFPHFLFELHQLGSRTSAGGYARHATTVLESLHQQGVTPLLVGGSGLYLRALMRGLAQEPPHDPELRARLAAEAADSGIPALHARLERVDPETAARLAPGDRQRVLRALEVFEASGRPLSWWHARPPNPTPEAEWNLVELVADPAQLEGRIAARTRAMFASGLIEEAIALVEQGHEAALRALRAVGYDEALDSIAGRMTRVEAETRTTLRTRQLAKRQRTWFRHQVDAVRLDTEDTSAEILAEQVAEVWFGRGAGRSSHARD